MCVRWSRLSRRIDGMPLLSMRVNSAVSVFDLHIGFKLPFSASSPIAPAATTNKANKPNMMDPGLAG